MKKKRLIAYVLAGVCALTLLAGCGKDENKEEKEKETDKKEEQDAEVEDEDAVTLGDYKGIEVSLDNAEVTEEDVKQYIESMITAYERYPVFEILDKTVVEDGDEVNIDYEGIMDGEAFQGGTASNQVLKIGSNSFIEGFEEGLVGASVGDSLELNLSFPDPYKNNEELSGKPVVFNVKVNAIVKTEPMTYENLTDEYVANNFGPMGVETVQALKDIVTNDIKSSNQYNAETTKRNEIVRKLGEICTVNVSKKLLDQRVAEYKEQFAARCKEQFDMELADYLKQYNTTEEEFNTQTEEMIKSNLETELILLAIAEKEGLEVDEEGYQQYLTNIMSQYGETDQDAFVEEYGEDFLKDSYLCNKAMDLVVEHAVIIGADTGTEADPGSESGPGTEADPGSESGPGAEEGSGTEADPDNGE